MDAKTDAKKKSGTITIGNKNWDFPIYDGTIGPEVLDIAKLYGESGMFTYDPGFTSTASCESKITYIDADSAPTTPHITAIGCASRRKPRKNELICSCTMVWRVMSRSNFTFCASVGNSPLSSR